MFYDVCKKIVTAVFSVIFRIRIVREYDSLPDGGLILSSNHISLFDPCFIAVGCEKKISFMAKAELFKIPVLSSVIKGLGAFPVKRGANDVSALKSSINALKDGKSLGIFPQGTRRRHEKPWTTEIKSGIGMISANAEVGFLPIAIITKNDSVHMFSKITVVYGKPISYGEIAAENHGRAEYQRIADTVFSRICELYKKYSDGEK